MTNDIMVYVMRHAPYYHQLVIHETPAGFEEEYAAIRAAFVQRGCSLNSWLRQNGINRQSAYRALRGKSLGRRSTEIRRSVLAAAFEANQ